MWEKTTWKRIVMILHMEFIASIFSYLHIIPYFKKKNSYNCSSFCSISCKTRMVISWINRIWKPLRWVHHYCVHIDKWFAFIDRIFNCRRIYSIPIILQKFYQSRNMTKTCENQNPEHRSGTSGENVQKERCSMKLISHGTINMWLKLSSS